MIVVLLGYMASGKSSIGKKLAKRLDFKFVDLDDYIAKKEAISIPEIFKKKGEIYFRKKESEILNELLHQNEDFILAVGGGTPCYGNNMEIINTNAKSIYLKGSINAIYTKLSKPKNKQKRPLITTISDKDLKEFIAKHLFERSQYFEQADFTIVIDNKTKAEIVEEINSNMQ
jgi:shikimate kinase